MKKLLQELIDNESGLILSAEMVLILTIAVLGVVVGLSQIQTAVVSELQDLSLAFSGMNQSFSTPSFFGCRKRWGNTAFTAGSGFIDFYDGCIGGGFGGGGGGFGGGGYGGGGYSGGYSGTGGYAEIGSGNCVTQGTCAPGTVVAPQTSTVPCDTCTPGSVTTAPESTNTTPTGPTPLPPAPDPVPHLE